MLPKFCHCHLRDTPHLAHTVASESRVNTDRADAEILVHRELARRLITGCVSSDTPKPDDVNFAQAVYHLTIAAKAGSVEAQADLGRLHMFGDTKGKQRNPKNINYTKAFKWLSLAAEAGNPHACVHLAMLSANGLTQGNAPKDENVNHVLAFANLKKAIHVDILKPKIEGFLRKFIARHSTTREDKEPYLYLLQLLKKPDIITKTLEGASTTPPQAQFIIKMLLRFEQGLLDPKLMHRYLTQFFIKNPELIETFLLHATLAQKLEFLDRYAACEYNAHDNLTTAIAAIQKSCTQGLPADMSDQQKLAIVFSIFMSEKRHQVNKELMARMEATRFQGSLGDFISKTQEGQQAYLNLAALGLIFKEKVAQQAEA